MGIVARMARRLALLALVAALGACAPAPSASPGPAGSGSPAGSAGASPGPTSIAADSPPPCVQQGPPQTVPPPWQDRVFYEVFVRSFADGDADGIGDLIGLTDRLDYLNDGDPSTTDDLGVTGIWLMPVAEAVSYHGYDVVDYTKIETDYGDRSAFEAFIAKAHDRGILVIVDFVINHTSSEHPWFEDSRTNGSKRDWYVWSQGDPRWPAVAGPNPWHRVGDSDDYYYGAFSDRMPDLNLRNPAVTAELEAAARFWLDELDVDGFRIDAAKHLIETDGTHQVNTPETLAWLKDFTAAIHADHPEALVLSEVFDFARNAASYVPESSDLTFDFGMADATISALQTRRTPPIHTALDETLAEWPPNREAAFLSNHDQDRVMSQLNGDVASAKLAAFMLLTGPGVPFVYYGEEIGMQGRKPDERIRTPMQWSAEIPAGGFSTFEPWEPPADDWKTVNVALQRTDPASLLSTYRAAIATRAAHPALTAGTTARIDGGATTVTGWLRSDRDERLLVVVNVGDAPVSEYGLSLAEGPLCGDVAATLIAAANAEGAPGEPGSPVVSSSGGFEGYRPFVTLPPRSGFVVDLSPQP